MTTLLWITAVIIEAIGFASRGDSGAQVFLTIIGLFLGFVFLMGLAS